MARRKSCKYGKLKHKVGRRVCKLGRRKRGLTKADVKRYHEITGHLGRRSRR